MLTADDEAMMDEDVDAISTTLINFVDAALEKTDIRVKLSKTFSQHL